MKIWLTHTTQPPPYKPGDSVKYEGRVYQVVAATHAHTQLEGVAKAVANWKLQPVKLRKKKLSP